MRKKGPRKMPTSTLLRAIRRAKTLQSTKYTLSGKERAGAMAPKPITLRRTTPL